MPYVAGIDFGTSNSSAAISDGGTPKMVDVESGHDTIPTALFFPDKSADVRFGRDARRIYMDAETDGRFMRSMKRILGTSLMDGITVVNGRPTRFDEIIAFFVKHLKSHIDRAAGQNVESVVMGRPVHFRDDDAAGDARAVAELEKISHAAGFKNVSFQYEPIAAAFAHEEKLTDEKLAFVADIGGGTSDFSVIRLSPWRRIALNRDADILANTGVRIGGNDFDRALALQSFMPNLGMGTDYRSGDKTIQIPNAPYFSLATWSAVNEVYNIKTLNMVRGFTVWGNAPDKMMRLYEIIDGRLGHKHLDYVEDTKMKLSHETNAHVVLDFLSDTPELDIDRETFESAIAPDAARIAGAVRECIKRAGIKNTDINLVILTGGSTEVPCISRMMTEFFPNAEISGGNKLASVGLGLAYDAMRRYLN